MKCKKKTFNLGGLIILKFLQMVSGTQGFERLLLLLWYLMVSFCLHIQKRWYIFMCRERQRERERGGGVCWPYIALLLVWDGDGWWKNALLVGLVLDSLALMWIISLGKAWGMRYTCWVMCGARMILFGCAWKGKEYFNFWCFEAKYMFLENFD